MIFTLIGTIKKITPIQYGLCLLIRETQIGWKTKNGHEMGTYDYTWNCVVQSEALQSYVQKYFRVGAVVQVIGQVEQAADKENKKPNLYNGIYKIKCIDLWNMGDPKKRKIRERYNSKVVGDEKPNPNIDDDF